MEIGGTGEVRRNGRIVSAAAPARKTPSGLTSNTQARADRLALSSQVLSYLDERNRQMMEEARKQKSDSSGDGGKLDMLEKGLKTLNKCQKIYARVANGDKVPPEDLRYLEKNDPEGYKMALAMRKPNKHPKDWESVLDDEDKNGGSETADPPISSGEEA